MVSDTRIFTKKNILRVLWIFYALFSIVVWLPQMDHLLSKDYEEISKHISLDQHWDIRINDSFYQDVSLDNFSFDTVDKGDQITMEREIPQDWGDIQQGVLRFHIRQTAVKMYVDDHLIYQYGFDRIDKNKTVGSGFQFINFSDKFKGGRLKIELSVTENDAFSRFDSIRIYKWENAYRVLMTENRIPMFLGCFLSLFGLSIVMITMFALLLSRKYMRIFCIAAFSICMGLWTLCYYNVMLIFSIPLYSISLIEYMALFLAPLPLFIYMWENVKNLKSRIFKTIYGVLFFIQMVFDMVILTLHTLDIVHCAAVLKYLQFLIVCDLIYVTLVLVLNLKNSKRVNRMYLIGMLIVAGCTVYDLISYYCNRYLASTFFTGKGVASMGVMILIFILIYTFYINLTEKMMQETERNSLIKCAYTDDLTQLANRRYCSEYMKKLENSDYTVICFDLNNLKTTNDTYGHAKGDILIKSAADVIAETFQKYGVVGRMGGDEFIAIIRLFQQEEISSLMGQFEFNIGRKNQEVTDLNLSIAYGYAVCGEQGERNIEKIYQIADDRMYQNKIQSKRKKENSLSGC